MSHFSTLVLVNEPITREEAEEAVTPLLAPYDENFEWFADNSRWDWWQVGGRWTGALSADYNPEDDPRNIQTCAVCEGTGERPGGREQFGDSWYEWCNGCNGCMGKGTHSVWPTDFEEFDGDVSPVRGLQFKTYRWEEDGEQRERLFTPSAVVTPDGKWHEQGRVGWFGVTIVDEDGNGAKSENLWRATVTSLLEQHPDAYAVIVDCHV